MSAKEHTHADHARQAGNATLRIGVADFLLIAGQLALVLLVIRTFRLEELSGFSVLIPVVFAGFVIHAWLPHRLRMPLFVLMFVVAAGLVLGAGLASRLIAIGLVLIGIAHLPIRMRFRALLLVAVGAAVVLLRVGWPLTTDSHPLIVPILGAMFMFRMVVYLYDVSHQKTRARLWHRLGYFFLFPNVCFPLFPVVDYETFRRTYYNRASVEIYQKGLHWMLRGATHLLLYRLIYYHVIPAPSEVADVGALALFMMSTYLLYLRISGQFHLIVGMLCLFGFNLPETHRNYLLASGFNDLWRRINIYWKDFMMKVVYYPTFFLLKRRGLHVALVGSTLVVFILSWMLHSYQWFWLRGSFPFTVQDAVFWILFGILVAANTLWQAKRGKRRTSKEDGWSLSDAVRLSFRTAAMFVFMCVLWSFWTSASPGEWSSIVVAGLADTTGAAAVAGFLLAAIAIGVLIQYVRSAPAPRKSEGRRSGRLVPALVTGGVALLLLVMARPELNERLGTRTARFVASLRQDRFNQRDVEMMTRGYYEELTGADGFTSQLWRVQMQQPADWKSLYETDAIRETGDMRLYELLPGADFEFKRARLVTNSWAMRDKEYAKAKPAGVYRIALHGASYTMGSGVDNEDVFEAVLEDELNMQRPFGHEAYEILNFGVGGYSLIEMVTVNEGKALDFEPDASFLMSHANERLRIVGNFVRHARRHNREGTPFEDAFLEEIRQQVQLTPDLDDLEARQKVQPWADDLLAWGYRKFAADCRAADATPVWVYSPLLDDLSRTDADIEGLKRIAREAGLVTLSLEGVYAGHEHRSLQIAPWDTHLNVEGNRLVADRMLAVLRENSEVLGLVAKTGRKAGADPPGSARVSDNDQEGS